MCWLYHAVNLVFYHLKLLIMHSPKYKVSRTLGCNLWGRQKDPYNFKNYFPGQHGKTTVRIATQFALQLRAKQRLRIYYNMREKQFANTFGLARKKSGDTGENLINLLERRLEMVLYRANFVPTIFAARQLVSHGHILVNDKKVNIRSYRLKDNDRVTLTKKGKDIKIIQEAIVASARNVPDYLRVEDEGQAIFFVRRPTFTEVPYEVKMELNWVIEYYSH